MERIKWLCSKALLHVCAFTWTVLSPNRKLTHTQKHIYRFFLRNLILPCRFPPPCFLRGFEGEKKQFYLVFFPPLYLLKSHFIKVMDNTSNKIATAAIIARQWHHVAGRTKYDSPFNAYDLQNLLQVHTVIKEKKKSGFRQVGTGKPPGVCIFTLTVNQCYQPPIR